MEEMDTAEMMEMGDDGDGGEEHKAEPRPKRRRHIEDGDRTTGK